MCYGLDLLRSVFFSRLCRQRLWARLSVTLSGFSSSIRQIAMRPYFWLFMLLAIFSPILGINEVYAQESTNTPTWQPLFPTGTPRPTINSNCPDGQPSGWGTVTPSFNWLANCSQCIQRATADWSDFEATPFPQPYISHLGNCTLEELDDGCQIITHGAGLACQCVGQLTPTPNGSLPTPNMTATNQASHYYVKINPINQRLGTNATYYDGNWIESSTFYGDTCYPDINHARFMRVSGYANYYEPGSWNNTWWGIGASDYSQYPGINYYDKYSCSDNLDVSGNGCDTLVNNYGYVWNQTFSGGYGQPLDQTFTITFNTWKAEPDGYADWHYIGWLCYGNNESAPIQPIPTIDTDSDYCNEVEAKPVYEADEVGLELPTPAYGQGQCVVIGFNIGTAWLENLFPNLFQFNVPDSLGVPDFQVCLRPMTLGDVNIFGLLIDVDYLLLAASLIMVVRWLFRS